MIMIVGAPYRDRVTQDERFIMWVESPGEGLAPMYAVGGDPDAQRCDTMNTVEAYWITPIQFAEMIALAGRVTDKWGLVEWCARRDGRDDRLKVIAEFRANGV